MVNTTIGGTTGAPVDKTGWPNATFAEPPKRSAKIEAAMERAFKTGTTLSVFGGPGTGKTSSVFDWTHNRFSGRVRVVYLNAPNKNTEDLALDAPNRDDETGEITLNPNLDEELVAQFDENGDLIPYVLLLDDPNQSVNKSVQNLFMQAKHDGTINGHDLKANGCILIVELNNDSLGDTNSLTTDLAALDRVTTITVGANDTGWRWALAQKYADVDLTQVFDIWASMPAEIRNDLPPRVLDHVLQALLLGYPGKTGLPLTADGYRRLYAKDGDRVHDRTEHYISAIAAAIGAPNPERVENIVAKAVRDAIRHNLTILIEGPPGGGKTALTLDTIAEELGGNPRDYYWSIPTTDPERYTMPLPVDGVIRQILTQPFQTQERKCLVLDEANRGGVPVQSRLMELNQEHTIAGKPIPGLSGIVNIQNPPYVMGRKMQVSKRNRAQSERFTLNIKLSDNDINSNEWLLTVFPHKWAEQVAKVEAIDGIEPGSAESTNPEAAVRDAHHVVEVILEWYKNDLDDEGRQWITSRGIERLARTLLVGGDPDEAIIHYAPGEKAPVITASLRARLADNPLTSLGEIAANLDTWIAKMDESNAGVAVHGTADVDLVMRALQQAEASQLTEHTEVVIQLLHRLPKKHRKSLLNTSAEKVDFWVNTLTERARRIAAGEMESLG